jgi:hypothetical protein
LHGWHTAGNCTSTIQMTAQSGLCQQFFVGDPQDGQTPNNRLSNVAQTVNWRVDPGTYTGSTFDITVTWRLSWRRARRICDIGASSGVLFRTQDGPNGYCNPYGCSCGIHSKSALTTVSHTFKVPLPSSSQCP